jgi:dimethylargininase
LLVSTRFTRAILRPPGASYADGITTSTEGAPDVALAVKQHAAYGAALEKLGLTLTWLAADEAYPDSTFVEDTAIVTPEAAILTRPGAVSRAGEVAAMAPVLEAAFGAYRRIEAPGTLDGGDICETDDGVLIGITARTNVAGGEQLARHLADLGLKSELVDIRSVEALLHLKTGICYLGEGRMAVAPGLPELAALKRFECVELHPDEAYAANCIRVNDTVLIAAGYPRFAEALDKLGHKLLPLNMSEFRKMDGGLSCLSLRF